MSPRQHRRERRAPGAAPGGVESPPRVGVLVNIDVPDLEAAIEFYQRAFGLTLARRLFEGTVAELGGGSARILTLAEGDGK